MPSTSNPPPEPGGCYVRSHSIRRYTVGEIFVETWGLAVVTDVAQMTEPLGEGLLAKVPLWTVHLRRLTAAEEAVTEVLRG